MTEIDSKFGEVMPSRHVGGLPVDLKRNYTELPQKPITLKTGIGGLAGPRRKRPVQATATKPNKPAPVPPRLRPAKRPRKATTQWTLRGISPEAREVALQAAKQEGMPVGQWLDRVISQAVAPAPEPPDRLSRVLETLADIQARLDRIEQGPDWWLRLKQFLKTCVEYGRSG